ncbi:Tad domain-containing protein [Novosphingobium sp. BW1]|uniref:Tad domain-containing protein n=1 Tax=Novosphingobium sp. BW1 TaxID=2592621 RepID=UPI0011DE83BE|nr:Tad domain-containing protein [Novosphingobium sp. BW1]TYC87701.1 hypothetical protein FMM79_11210 [Novosphingobium sp. BW1]
MALLPHLKRLIAEPDGNTMLIVAAALLPLIAIIGGGLDMSVAYLVRGKLQNACDAGVLAGRQIMEGSRWNRTAEDEADRFFDFNFEEGLLGTREVAFEARPNADDTNEILGTAHATVPMSLMRIFGYQQTEVTVDCNAKRDMGHNDVMLVLDVTGSMNNAPSSGGSTKILRLRSGAMGLYRALDEDNGSVTRFGIMPYSHTVNVGRSLMNKDILKEQPYVHVGRVCYGNGRNQSCYNRLETKWVDINESSWNIGRGGGDTGGNTQNFRTSGDGCIEERPSIGNTLDPFEIETRVTREDIDTRAGNAGNQPELQFGRYDPGVQEMEDQHGCPSEATTLREYSSESRFQTAVNDATARVTGGTYHDIGMLWGVRFISRTGFFASDNPLERDDVPVRQHIVFMTDGRLDTDAGNGGHNLYSAYGLQYYQERVRGSGAMRDRHISRFESACTVAKSMGITIWVIALDVTDTDDIESCATSSSQFYTSDGSDMEQIFEDIGRGIGNLRLTR